MAAPAIETQRFVLRSHRVEDFDGYAAMWADPGVTRFIGGSPISREAAWSRMMRQLGMWQAMGFGFWAVETKATGAFVGEAGFHDLKRDLTPSLEGTLEAGWGFVPAVHGQGVATEVVAAVLAWGERTRPDMPITCMMDPQNLRSRRVAEKHGFREFARTTYHGAPAVLFERRP